MKISNYLVKILSNNNNGKIHSIFKNSFNIVVDDLLINISNHPTFISSFGININEIDNILNYIKIDDNVVIKDKVIIIYTNGKQIKINTNDYEVVNLQYNIISDYSINNINILITYIKTIDIINSIGLDIKDISEFTNFMCQSNVKNSEVIIKYFIGRGNGLTPSGDDILCGYLFILKLFNSTDVNNIAITIMQYLSKTNIISQNYLKLVTHNYISSYIHDLYKSIKNNEEEFYKKNINNILNIGHHSGNDFMYGLYLGLLKIRSEYEYKSS